MSSPSDERVITYGEAILEALASEMDRDSSIFVMGQGVDDLNGTFGTTRNLHREFGMERCFDTPIAEESMTGIAIGAALNGMRPVHVHQRADFLMVCMNQLGNMAAKMSYMYAGALRVPLVIRAAIGRSWGQGAQHSQSLYGILMHIPGLKVVVPTTPYDAKGSLIAAIRDNNPVIMIEHRMLYATKGCVPRESYECPIGKARVLRQGKDVSIVALSHMVVEAMRASEVLAANGIETEVIDPVSVAPLDIDTILTSVAKTGRLLVVDNDWTAGGVSAEILALVLERAGSRRQVVAGRMGYRPTPCPTTPPLEGLFYPDVGRIAEAVANLIPDARLSRVPDIVPGPEIQAFRGPF